MVSMLERFSVQNEMGRVDYAAFFRKLGVVLDPSDANGVSSDIIYNSNLEEQHHMEDQLDRSAI